MRKGFFTSYLTVLILALVAVLTSAVAFAQATVGPAETPDLGALILNLVTNYKTLGPIGIAMVSVNIVVAALKSDILGSVFKGFDPLLKGLIITALGQVAAILAYYINTPGASVVGSIVFGLVTSGGAVAIYEAYNLFKKQAKA